MFYVTDIKPQANHNQRENFLKIKYNWSSEWSSVSVSCRAVNSIICPTCISGFHHQAILRNWTPQQSPTMPITAFWPNSYSTFERLLPFIYRQAMGQESKKPTIFLCFCFLRSTKNSFLWQELQNTMWKLISNSKPIGNEWRGPNVIKWCGKTTLTHKHAWFPTEMTKYKNKPDWNARN